MTRKLNIAERKLINLASEWGELKNGIHTAGYTFERACRKIEWFLEDDRYAELGLTLNEFVDSINLDSLRASAEARKRIANRIKELQPTASIRKVAKMIGVGKSTVHRDTVPNGTSRAKNTSPIKGRTAPSVPNGTPISGAKAAKIVERRTTGVANLQEKRAEREQKLGTEILALPEEKFGVIYADPEWKDDVWSEETGNNKSAVQHYSTSDIETIKARPVQSIAADDCVLFLWTTTQHLDVAIDVLRAWGFTYRSDYIWRKPHVGTGRWNRSRHETLLIGTRGTPPCPAPGTQWDSVIDAARGEHSAKPEAFLEMIEQYFPTMPKIELNRRGKPRPGWTAWGNEVQQAAE